jgi:hypothetical protein
VNTGNGAQGADKNDVLNFQTLLLHLLKAMGGELVVRAVFPDRPIEISKFSSLAGNLGKERTGKKKQAWDVAEREDAAIAADLVSRACLRERYCCAEGSAYSKGRKQPLILHTDHDLSMCGATLEVRLGELGVLRSFSRPRVSNDNPY